MTNRCRETCNLLQLDTARAHRKGLASVRVAFRGLRSASDPHCASCSHQAEKPCGDGMPSSQYVYGYMVNLLQGGPTWTSGYSVIGQVGVSTYAASSCSYKAEWEEGGYQSLFSWQN